MKKTFLIATALLGMLCISGCGNDKPNSEDAKTESTSKVETEKERMESFARTFGNKPVKKLQKAVNTYPSTKDGNNIVYGWKVDNMMFYRVDAPDGTTTVYCSKDGDKEESGSYGVKCYEGRTITE